MTYPRTGESRDVDIAIVGGGPAGLAAGIEARLAGFDVRLFEPEEPPIDKACGEGLMPAALDELGRLGVEMPEGYPLRGVRYRHVDTSAEASGDFTGGYGRGVRRLELHRSLWSRARELGVEFVPSRVDEVEQDPKWVRVDDTRARYLIGADGLHSQIRRQLPFDVEVREPRRWGVRRHFRREPPSSYVEVHWAPDGEAYVTPVGPETVGVALLSEQGGRFDDLVSAFPRLERWLAGAETLSEDRGAGPFHQSVSSPVDGRTLLVGDAAGYVDALTGEGVALALRSSRAAVGAIASGRPSAYRAEWTRLSRAYRWTTQGLIGLTRSASVHRPLIELLDRVPGLFDASLRLLGGKRRSRRLARSA